jgi:cellulose synthase/poly-beta-1,6-N-acetylglucosamine synthase-like glycosyltransferase
MTGFLLLWLVTQAIAVVLVWIFTIGLGHVPRPAKTPRVVVIVAVKGHGDELDHFLAHLFDQDYPFYRVIFAVETADDPAVRPIESWRAKLGDRVSIVVAGLTQTEGQKTANLRAAVREVRPTDEVVIFADADIRPLRDWLKRLVEPLLEGRADLVSGFAWLVVKDRSFSSYVMASMAATMITVPRLPFLNAVWGGSVSMFRETFEALDLDEAWRGTLCDDLHLTVIAQKAGYRIAAPREMLPRLFVSTRGFDDVAADALRWLMLFRIYMPLTYVLVMIGLNFAVAGWLVALYGTLTGDPTAFLVLVGGFILAILRSLARAVIVARLWGRQGFVENGRFLLFDPLATPVAAAFNAFYGWGALFKRRTTWAGITYEVLGPKHTRVLARRSAA